MSASPATREPITRDRFDEHVQRLIDLSVGETYDAFEDVPWDDPAFAVEPGDPRLEPFSFDPLRATRRFEQLTPQQRSQLGLERVAVNMRIGWQFENVLQQGLLRQALWMGNDERAFAYIHHEIIEESQHSMMFHELARRHAPHVEGLLSLDLRIGQAIARWTPRRAPALFFFFVLGGEIPIDTLQRRALREDDVHPLVERITRIHVEEEARHVSYASQELRRRVPRMGRTSRLALGVSVALVMAVMARLMVWPSVWLARRWDIGLRDYLQAVRRPQARQLLADSVARIRSLCHELGLMSRPARAIWRAAGIWAAPAR